MSTEHAPLPSSAAPCWGNCSAWPVANLGAPNIDTPESLAGTAAHWVVSECLEQHRGGRPMTCEHWLNKTAPNGTVIDEDMVEGAQIMVDDVLDIAGRHGGVYDLMIEHQVFMPDIHDQNWGTLDCGLWIPRLRTVILWDYKHGHREVDPRNPQMVDYIKGIANEVCPGLDDRDTDVTVNIRIVQPFAFSPSGAVKEWTGTLADLRGDFNRLHFMAHQAFTDPKMTPGEQCRDCAAVGKCSAAREYHYRFMDMLERPYAIDVMTSADMAAERLILKAGRTISKARLAAIEEQLKHDIKNGVVGSGLTVESGRGHLKWTIPPAQAIALCRQFGSDASKDVAKTPTQAIADAPKAKKEMLKATLKSVTTRPPTGLKLIDASESKTARAFQRK